ncbi:hypothetical protein BP5796_02320 [Coleophoma crateriformis]|uniref:Transcriptional coactivator HFI1 n=1 Tax=Coleophoma crateriformis TaxID=565419 RepID=A0A3D8SXW7_9HELO|nr:hypothetical protein BP5796_02320 [Coleophoma crateriformis]
MPDIDIDPAALSRPAGISTTPILPPKTIGTSSTNAPKVVKSSQLPPRIDLEPLYKALKDAVGEHWGTYKESISLFVMGQLNQAELSSRIDKFIVTPSGDIEHAHNKLIAGIFGNVTRDMPDHGLAPFVSANETPTAGAGNKPISGDAAEQRLKQEVMQLPSRDRRRIKDLTSNEYDPYNDFASMLGEHRRSKPAKVAEPVAAGAGALSKTNWDIEIRKRFAQPLASESGEFPDISTIESRMLPICYETGLQSGHVADAAYFMSVATETFIKEVLSAIFSKTRSNGPGAAGSAGTGGGANWIQTHKYRVQLEHEEESWLAGETQRDKNGLLPVEAKIAGERGPLGMADVRTALEIGDCGLGQMPSVVQQIMFGYREGELEGWDEYSWPNNYAPGPGMDEDVEMSGMNPEGESNGLNGHVADDSDDDWGWEGAAPQDRDALDSLLDSCLAIGS